MSGIPANQHSSHQAKRKNTARYYKHCVYTIAHKNKLELAFLEQHPVVFKEGRKWKAVEKYMISAGTEGSHVPIIKIRSATTKCTHCSGS